MRTIYIFLLSLLVFTACEDLDQAPENKFSASSITDFTGVLNAAYYYQLGAVTPMAVVSEFRSDNAFMAESPYTDFDEFNKKLASSQEAQFFLPLYSQLYKSILSANTVIEYSEDAATVGEAKFLRALAYFNLVKVFGDVPINTSSEPSISDPTISERDPASKVYNDVIIPDLQAAIAVLDNDAIVDGRASKLAAQALLGKVYAQMGDYPNAETALKVAIDAAPAAGVELEANFTDIFGALNAGSSEIIFDQQISVSVIDEYTYASRFWNWFVGDDSKSDYPVDADLVAAFDASDAASGSTDLRRAVTLDAAGQTAIKYPKYADGTGTESNWIEIRLADIILLYAEAQNENLVSPTLVLPLLDDIRTRAGLPSLTGTISTQAEVRQAILDERRLELAFEGQRWYDLTRTGTATAEMGVTVDPGFYVFPYPTYPILASDGAAVQNEAYQ